MHQCEAPDAHPSRYNHPAELKGSMQPCVHACAEMWRMLSCHRCGQHKPLVKQVTATAAVLRAAAAPCCQCAAERAELPAWRIMLPCSLSELPALNPETSPGSTPSAAFRSSVGQSSRP